jgi:YHS domain-containing protein
MTRDPVCGMEVDPDTTEFKSEYDGKTYYFCWTGCKQAFDDEPQRFSGKEPPDYVGDESAEGYRNA